MKQRQPPSVSVVTFQQSGCVVYLGPTWKYQPDTVLFIEIEHHNMSFVFPGVERLHFSLKEEGWSIPFYFFANLAIRAQNTLPQRFNHSHQRVLELLDVSVNLIRIRRFC